MDGPVNPEVRPVKLGPFAKAVGSNLSLDIILISTL